MWRRLASALVLGGVITIAILFTMQRLIATPRGELDESAARHFVDFVRVEREEATERKDRRPERPEAPDAKPPAAPETRTSSFDAAEVSIAVPRAPTSIDMSIQGLGLAASDGDYLPIVKIAPTYPMNARTRGIEGHCVVEYTVTVAGTVRDPIVVESEPRGVFDRTSIEAALRFKYRPRVVDGEPIEVRGVRNLFRYELED